MNTKINAIYEKGILRPTKPLKLVEGTKVRLTLVPEDGQHDPLAAVIGIGSSGRTDGAENHDHYIYGTKKRS
jgi:predicted DNA-binding antitoxin AbrB/MazE fold protein